MANNPIDYTSRDFDALRSDLIARIPDFLPEWTDNNDADFGVVMIDLFAHAGDILNYYIDRIAQEAFLQTATQRESVLRIAGMLGYTPVQQQGATIPITLSNDATPIRNGGVQFVISASAGGPITIPAGTQVVTAPGTDGSAPIVFETITTRTIAVGGTDYVDAVEGTTVTLELIGQSTGRDLQEFKLSFPNVIFGSIQVFVAEGPGTTGSPVNVLWSYFGQITDAGMVDSAYTITQDNAGNAFIKFGDGVNGRIPPVGMNILVTYRHGVGSVGNVGTNSIISTAQAIVGVQSVTNTVAASGGTDPESIDSMRISVPRSVKSLQRAVTTADFANIALQVPGVARALATGSFFTQIALYIAPAGGGNASTTLKNSVINYLTPRSLAGTVLTVFDPIYMPVNISVTVNVLPTYNQTSVVNAVKTVLQLAFTFDNRQFNEIVSVGEVYRLLQDIVGVDFITITKMVRSDASTQAVVENLDPAAVPLHGNGFPQNIFTQGTFLYTGVGGVS